MWKVVSLWSLPAADLLSQGDVGLIPWIPLTHFEGPPEPMFAEYRARIDADAPADERENLLAVSQILAGLRYNDPKLFQILGGTKAMIESPVLQAVLAERTRETRRKDIARFLAGRFGTDAKGLSTVLETIEDEARLDELVTLAAVCPSLEAFRAGLSG